MRRLGRLLLLVSVAAAGAAHAQSDAPAQDALKQILAEGSAAYIDWPVSLAERERAGRLYQEQGYRLLWSTGAQPTAAALALLEELKHAENRALDPLDYPGARLSAMLVNSSGAKLPWALFDASLTLGGLRFISDLHFGRIDPAAVGHNLTVNRVALDPAAVLTRLAAANEVSAQLDALEPKFIHFALLKKELAHYRELAGEPGLNQLPPLPARSVKPGGAYAGAAQLERLLIALGDAPPSPTPAQALTPALSAALKHFQARHGETPDGTLGATTYVELTRPLGERVRQIELTMERWRWMPAELLSAPIIVNVPQFRLFAFDSTVDSEAKMHQMDVIVGKAFQAHQTPVFSADMTYLVFRPYWEVPFSIAMKELVPAARRDPSYLERHQMEIVNGFGDAAPIVPSTRENIEAVAKGSMRIRQKPGPNNSLGLIKFMLPNPYNVYLHSTPAQALFREARRDFSHGCVRVSDPVSLAEHVLGDSPEWTREKILAAMNGTETLTVPLKNRIRVFIVYGTALATEKGEILFLDDIYGHDRRLALALKARPEHSAVAEK